MANLNEFKTLNEAELATVEGGYTSRDCSKDFGGYVLEGTAGGALWGGVTTGGIGAIPGAFVGAHVGAVAGGFVCLAGMAGNIFH